MIFYFSGTGNSQFVAKRIQDKTGDQLYSLNEAIKNADFFQEKCWIGLYLWCPPMPGEYRKLWKPGYASQNLELESGHIL